MHKRSRKRDRNVVHQRYILLSSDTPVMRLHIGHNFVLPRHLSQHSEQQVCQQPVETVGSAYTSKQIRQLKDVEAVLGACCTHCKQREVVCGKYILRY